MINHNSSDARLWFIIYCFTLNHLRRDVHTTTEYIRATVTDILCSVYWWTFYGTCGRVWWLYMCNAKTKRREKSDGVELYIVGLGTRNGFGNFLWLSCPARLLTLTFADSHPPPARASHSTGGHCCQVYRKSTTIWLIQIHLTAFTILIDFKKIYTYIHFFTPTGWNICS